ncbi:MAG: ATPase [Actinobacteria bacterium]|nr:MAG: ATPase [Actinomycetota bacterium]
MIAVDGGGSKTDVALVRGNGEALALVRGPSSHAHHVGVEGSLDVIAGLLDEALADAQLASSDGAFAEVAAFTLAGADSPADEEALTAAAKARGWSSRTIVLNDTFAILRAGTTRGWGVAITCGAGINCVGVAPDGRHARFPSLGWISGDWGGGFDLGKDAVFAAARSEDGRGPRTSLERVVPAYFGLATPTELAEAMHYGRVPQRRVIELAPLVLAEAQADPVAAEIVSHLADEVVALARVALTRLDLANEPVEVLLGGGVLQDVDGDLLAAINAGLAEIGSQITVRPTASPAIIGAALIGLDELGADDDTQKRLRRELGAAFARLDGVPDSGRSNGG